MKIDTDYMGNMTEETLKKIRYKIDEELNSRSNAEIEVIKVEWGCGEYYFLNKDRAVAFNLVRRAVDWFEKSNKDEIDNVYLAGVNMYQVIKKEKDLEILLERTEVDLKTALAS